jgi:hypothetical protein
VNEIARLDTPTASLPTPAEVRTALLAAVQEGYAAEFAMRGTVTAPEDVHPLVRRLMDVSERAAAYAAAFDAGRKLADTLIAEELVEAVGEQDGVPLAGLSVPDDDGDIAVTLNAPNSHTFDVPQLVSAVALCDLEGPGWTMADQVRAVVEGDQGHPDDLGPMLFDLVTTAMHRLIALGTFTPQITKVKGLAAQLSKAGDTQLAAVVSGTISTTSKFKGVTTKRKDPK